jgi:hypothetical protein
MMTCFPHRPSAFRPALAIAAAALFGASAAGGQQTFPAPATAAPEAGAPAYADLADLLLASTVVADVTVRSTARIKGAEAASAPAGTQRQYVEADVNALLRSPAPLPPRVGYLFDVPLDARGRAPKLKKSRVLVFARPVPGSSGQLQLAARDAQAPWSPAAEARVRRIARELASADAPPAITGVGQAFHVPGSLPGEGETQIFLRTADNRPVSLSVLRRPGEERRFAVALSEIIDEAAGPPRRDTLLWYRLACALPAQLPATATGQLDDQNAALAREDYGFVLQRLGPCGRTRTAITG